MLSHGRICKKKLTNLTNTSFCSSKFVDLQLGNFWVALREASFFHLFQFVQLFPQFLFSVLPRLFRKGCQWAKGPRVPIYIYIYKQVLQSVSSFQLITGGGTKRHNLNLGQIIHNTQPFASLELSNMLSPEWKHKTVC